MTINNKPPRPLRRILFAAALFCALSFTANAQRWERNLLTGPGRTAEVGEWGVSQVSTGGYIAVGTSNVTSACGGFGNQFQNDVLVVRMNYNGTLAWANTYDIGAGAVPVPVCSDDRGGCIIECANGDFALCGDVTDYVAPPGVMAAWSFVMRINNAGVVAWTTVLGGPGRANRLIETTLGNAPNPAPGDPTTNAGDLVVCGDWGGGGNALGARLTRLTNLGGVLWDRRYTQGTAFGGFFTDVIECRQGANAGDVAAVGVVSGSWGVIRVNGNNGMVGAAPQGLAIWPANTARLVTLQEIQDNSNGIQGDLVVAGQTVPTVPPVPNTLDFYAARLSPDPCTMVLDRAHGDQSNATEDVAYDIEEILPPAASALVNGDLILAGTHTNLVTGNSDAMLIQIDPVALNLNAPPTGAGFVRYDNGTNLDWAFSVDPVYTTGVGLPTDGFIMCGTTGGNQMYLIKTNLTGSSFCDEGQIPDNPWTPGYSLSCPQVGLHPTSPSITRTVTAVSQSGINPICTRNPKLAIPSTSGAELTLTSQPNPVRNGGVLSLFCASANDVVATITINDASGRTIERITRTLTAGENKLELSTAGWASGSYIVTLTAGEETRSERVVVVE